MARAINYPAGFFEEDFKQHYRERGQQKYGLRLLAMVLLQEGKTFDEVSTLLCKTVKTLRFWLDRYASGGIEGLLCLSPGRGRKNRLSQKDQDELAELIAHHHHTHQGGRLRALDIQSLIYKKYEIKYVLSAVYALVHRLGLSWVTSRSTHPHSDMQAQESFKK